MSRPSASSEQPSNNYPQRRRNSNDIDNRNVLFYEEVEEEEIGGGGEGTTDALLVTAIKQGEQRLDRNNNNSNINTTERLNMHSALSSSYSNSNSNNNMRSYEQLHYQDPASSSGSRTALYRSLTFWPIPPITRGAILVTIVISLWAAYRLIRVYCTAPSYVIYREDITPLLLSPWYIPGQLSAILVAITNFILMSIYEKSLVHLLGGTRRLLVYWLIMLGFILGLRQLLGYLFCRGTGWAVPSLFFSNSVHECSYGLAPLLASTLMLQALRPNEKYMVYYGRQSHQYVTVYKLIIQMGLLFLNYFTRNILWWSITALIVGLFAAMLLHIIYTRRQRLHKKSFNTSIDMDITNRKDDHLSNDDDNNNDIGNEEDDDFDDFDDEDFIMEGGNASRTPFSSSRHRSHRASKKKSVTGCRRCLYALMQALKVATITMILLLIGNAIYTHKPPVDTAALARLSDEPYFLSLVIFSAPRRGDPDLLIRTLNSFLEPLPDNEASKDHADFYARVRIVVYTHFSNHTIYDRARREVGDTPKGRRYIKWIREEGNERNQRLHMSRALELVNADTKTSSAYVTLVEDDFPLCGDDAWQMLLRVLWEAGTHQPHRCGAFVGTGGTGIILHHSMIKPAAKLLVNTDYNQVPPDVLLQDCLLGRIPLCSYCKNTMIISRVILMRHLGYNTSTSNYRTYGKEMYQCGWRHPFNGDPDLLTV